MSDVRKFIHLLYAPTNFCNMGCQYCYLGKNTDELTDTSKALDTLKFAVESFLDRGITPFNLSFHGGEATAIPRKVLEQLLDFTHHYYLQHGDIIKAAKYPLNPLHIKTNLYNFDQLYDLFDHYKVSISGSVDLPLRLHEKYRTDKKGLSTLPKIEKNLRLLADYPHHKKISCVVTREHYDNLDDLIADIKYIHYDIGLDMTKFNVMFSFDSHSNLIKFDGKVSGTEMLTQEQQVDFYKRVRQEFLGTELELGLENHWFKEFTPEFCCSAVNCGDKFFLLQTNGDVYACPRGQASKKLFYGNIFKTDIEEVVRNGWKTVEALENKKAPNEDCYQCEYLPHCHQGCIFVREETGLTKSYTCLLQKEIYKHHPQRYPAYDAQYIQHYSKKFRFKNNVVSIPVKDVTPQKKKFVTSELYDEENALSQLILQDAVLQSVYAADCFQLRVDHVVYPLISPILSNKHDIVLMKTSSDIALLVKKNIFELHCQDVINNPLHLFFLRNTMVSYGDEKRVKQEHLVDYNLYRGAFSELADYSSSEISEEWFEFDLKPFLTLHQSLFLENVRNNLYITTKVLRDYHYQKQRKNAFYHIQAINLPFPFIEFYWLPS